VVETGAAAMDAACAVSGTAAGTVGTVATGAPARCCSDAAGSVALAPGAGAVSAEAGSTADGAAPAAAEGD